MHDRYVLWSAWPCGVDKKTGPISEHDKQNLGQCHCCGRTGQGNSTVVGLFTAVSALEISVGEGTNTWLTTDVCKLGVYIYSAVTKNRRRIYRHVLRLSCSEHYRINVGLTCMLTIGVRLSTMSKHWLILTAIHHRENSMEVYVACYFVWVWISSSYPKGRKQTEDYGFLGWDVICGRYQRFGWAYCPHIYGGRKLRIFENSDENTSIWT